MLMVSRRKDRGRGRERRRSNWGGRGGGNWAGRNHGRGGRGGGGDTDWHGVFLQCDRGCGDWTGTREKFRSGMIGDW